jgi:hypothetical protein
MKWLVTNTSTKTPLAKFRTKKEAIAFGRSLGGLFIVWKEK